MLPYLECILVCQQFDSISENFLKLSTMSVKFFLPHGSEVCLIARDGCLYEILVYFDSILGRVLQRGPISLCLLGSGQPTLESLRTRASRVCNV